MKSEALRRFPNVDAEETEDPDVLQTLGLEDAASTTRPRRRLLIALAVLLVPVAAFVLWRQVAGGPAYDYTTLAVTRGDLKVAVTATGNLETVNQVEVGSELSGVIATVAVDYNDRVTAGQVIARLDSDKLEAEVLRARAALEAARARVLEAEATVTETERAFARTRKLVTQTWRSENDLDIAQAAFDRARASLALAKAEVTEAEARLQSDETNLAKADIRAPIDGIVLERRIEPGQTMAASFEAPHLFTLAEDLTRMTLHVDVDEADIGQVEVGQAAVFTVDAYPDRRFTAEITEVRFAPQTVHSVVTYEALLAVDNGDLSLRPGMTATADITVESVEAALLVPNAAFRFVPPERDAGARRGGPLGRLLGRGRDAAEPAQVPDPAADDGRRTVWVLKEGAPAPLRVMPGASDGRMTAVQADDLPAGTPLIVAAKRAGR